MKISWKRGFLRLWAVVSILWVVGFGLGSYDYYRDSQEVAIPFDDIVIIDPLPGAVEERVRSSIEQLLAGKKGWTQFRQEWPEYKDMADPEFAFAIWRKFLPNLEFGEFLAEIGRAEYRNSVAQEDIDLAMIHAEMERRRVNAAVRSRYYEQTAADLLIAAVLGPIVIGFVGYILGWLIAGFAPEKPRDDV